ncbi:MAG: glycosyltransferase family 61 protein [Chitinophagaceae bacterium]|nr:glycosyltransferase family 61 protein [Chitinophagaceae bacterium]
MGPGGLKQSTKKLILKSINLIPVSSLTLGSPRRISSAENIANNDKTAEIINITGPHAIKEAPPGTIDEKVFFKFRQLYNRVQPASYIVKLKNARVWGNNGAIITSNDTLVSDVSKEFGAAKFDPSKHSVFNKIRLSKPLKFHGSVAVAASPGSNVFAHWICDIIPRLILLKKSNLIEKVDNIIINYKKSDFQLETFDKLGIPEDKILNCAENPDFHLAAETVYAPSYPNEHGTVNQWVCREVNDLFKPGIANAASGKGTRLYISRSNAVGRKIINEEELVSFLEQYGFEKIYGENYSIAEKIDLFGNAGCIIGPHGGGLTNIIFCRAGCSVVDIFPPGDFDTFFWSISNSNQLPYYYFFGEGEMPTEENDFSRRNADISINLEKFKALMKLLNL